MLDHLNDLNVELPRTNALLPHIDDLESALRKINDPSSPRLAPDLTRKAEAPSAEPRVAPWSFKEPQSPCFLVQIEW